MKLKIKRVKYNSINGPVEYLFDKEVNIIEGVSGTGKSPFMFLLMYSLGNSKAREFYIRHRKIKNQHWGDEQLDCWYFISHNNIEKHLHVKVEFINTNNKILLTVYDEITNLEICKKDLHSSKFSKWLIQEFNLPKKIIWKTTIIDRHIKDFSPFFSLAPGMPGNEGNLYDISKPYRANMNTYISAYAILNNRKEYNELLKSADDWGEIEKNITKKNLLYDYLNSFYYESDSNSQKTIKGKVNNVFEELENFHIRLVELKNERSKYNAIIKNISEESRVRRFIEKYNEIEIIKKIDINDFMSTVFSNSHAINLQLPTIKNKINDLNAKINDISSKIKKISKNLEVNSLFSEDNINKYLEKSIKNNISNIEENIFELDKNISDKNLKNFDLIITKWNKIFNTLSEDYKKSILEFANTEKNNKIEFENRTKIKYSTGGEYAQEYLYTFLGMNKKINSLGNDLPIIIDSLYEGKMNDGDLNQLQTKEQIFKDFINSKKSQIIVTMTDKDYNEIKDSIPNNVNIFKSPMQETSNNSPDR